MLGVVLWWAQGARAGLLGAGVTIDYLYPDASTVFDSSGSVTVGPGVEYTFFAPGNDYYAIDVSDSQVKATLLTAGSDTFDNQSFNGVRLTFSGLSMPISNVTLDMGSTISYHALTFNSSQIFLNMANVSWTHGDFTLLDVSFASAVPAPTAAWGGMALVGAMALVRLGGRRKCKAA